MSNTDNQVRLNMMDIQRLEQLIIELQEQIKEQTCDCVPPACALFNYDDVPDD